MSIGIYKITSPSSKVYIGQSINIEQRWKDYKYLKCKEQPKLYNSLRKYGPNNHKFEIIEECSIEYLNINEKNWIKYYNSMSDGLNLTEGGEDGKRCKESEELRRIKSMKSILQYNLKGEFLKEFLGAAEAIKEIGKGNGNNINDCARGIYKSTYGFIWRYKESNNFPLKIEPYVSNKGNINKWTEERRQKTKQSRTGETRSDVYKEKISKLKSKPVYQYDINNNLVNIYPSFGSFDGSKIIGTKKLGNIINKNIYYKGYKYSYEKY